MLQLYFPPFDAYLVDLMPFNLGFQNILGANFLWMGFTILSKIHSAYCDLNLSEEKTVQRKNFILSKTLFSKPSQLFIFALHIM